MNKENNTTFYKNRVRKDSIIFETANNVFINFNDNDDELKGFWLSKKLINMSEYSFYITLNFPSTFKDVNYIIMKKDIKTNKYKEFKRSVVKGDDLNTLLYAFGFDVEI